jgi:hypothetical protein
MVELGLIRSIALGLPEVLEEPHFEKAAFKVNKKIFATLDAKQHVLCVKLSVSNQDAFSSSDNSTIYPVPNKWGQQGWTLLNLQQVRTEMLVAILKTAYCDVAPKKLALFVTL